MIDMAPQFQMPIPPRKVSESIWLGFLTTLVVVFVILAVYDLITLEAIIAPILWLTFVAYGVCGEIKKEGGFRQYVFSILGVFIGKEYLEISSLGGPIPEINFGIQIFKWRSTQRCIAFDKIISVRWDAGQATSLAGRDMKDWYVYLRFNDPERAGRRYNPGQSIYVIGPSRRKEDTEAFGLSFIDLLRQAGLPLTLREEKLQLIKTPRYSYQP